MNVVEDVQFKYLTITEIEVRPNIHLSNLLRMLKQIYDENEGNLYFTDKAITYLLTRFQKYKIRQYIETIDNVQVQFSKDYLLNITNVNEFIKIKEAHDANRP